MSDRNRRQYGYIGPKKNANKGRLQKTRESGRGREEHRARPQSDAFHSYGQALFGGLRTVALHIFVVLRYILILSWTLLRTVTRALFRGLGLLSKSGPRITKQAVPLGALVLALGFLGLTVLFVAASKDLPDPDKLTDRSVAQSTKIYDRTGDHLLYEIFAEEKRTLVTLDQIPQHAINAIIATEDKEFYEHHGVRPLSMARAVLFGIVGSSRITGASTLTQQLVKNAILSPERTLMRKAREIILSIRLEQKYSKDQILQIYFNEIPYGSTNYGIASAAQSYFGKEVQDLTLAEAATLGGFPKAPTRYLNNPDALMERRNFVLRRMFDEGFITEDEKNQAQAAPLGIERQYGSIHAPHFVLYVKEKLVDQFGEQKVDSGGLRVITSLDWDYQQHAQLAVATHVSTTFEEAGANNAALVALDPNNGHILSMVGSADFHDDDIDGQFNVTTLGRRQPGSSFKPIVYAAAFEKGYTPETVLYDVVTDFAASGRSYKPLNYDLQEHGPVTMRQALQGSLNIPAVKALYLVGEKQGVSFAQRLGYTSLGANNFGLSLVLGGGEVRLIEHVNAFATFANGGVLHEPVSILKVEEPGGDVLFEWKSEKGKRVLDKDIAHTVSSVLSDDGARAYAFGGGGVLTLPGRPVAAKTGTTNGYVDAWTVGYTPSLVAGVWAGNTNNTPMTRGFGGSRVAAPIWNSFMAAALDGQPVESFAPAPHNSAKKAALRGSEGGSVTLLVDKVTGKLATSSTPEKYIVERTYTQAHSLLHYVHKDDPRGPIPEDPGNDPQYGIWEAAIQDWIRRKKEEDPDWDIVFSEPPTEEDDIHSIELIPSLAVVFPSPSSTIHSRTIVTDIRASAPRGVSKVTYLLNGRTIGSVRDHPFNLTYTARDLASGNHTLTVVVEDDVGNRLDQNVPFTLDAGPIPPGVLWASSNQRISPRDFPRTFFIRPLGTDRLASVRIVASAEGQQSQEIKTITSFGDLENGQLPITWVPAPQSGTWTLTAIASATDDTVSQDTITVTVN
jgi:1A family penicillin-binding protein